MISSALRGVSSTASVPPTKISFKRSAGFGQVRPARSSRAKTKCAADAGRVNGIAICPTEDKGARRFAAARTVPGSTDRTQRAFRVPDAPVSKFTLSLDGGNKGLLVSSENLCHAPQVATVKMAGQNGKNANANVTIQTPCGSSGRAKAAKRHQSRANPNRRAGR